MSTPKSPKKVPICRADFNGRIPIQIQEIEKAIQSADPDREESRPIEEPKINQKVSVDMSEQTCEIMFRPVCQCGQILGSLKMVYDMEECDGALVPTFVMFSPDRCPACKRKIIKVNHYKGKKIGDNIFIFMEENV